MDTRNRKCLYTFIVLRMVFPAFKLVLPGLLLWLSLPKWGFPRQDH